MIKKIRLFVFLALLILYARSNAQNCAASFNGVSSAAYVLSNIAVPNFTISFWFKAYGPGPMFSSSNDSSGTSGVGDRRIYIDGNGILRAGVYNDGPQIINSNTVVLDSACHHLAFTQSNTGIQLFIDGVSKGSLNVVSADQTDVPPFYWVVGHEYMIGDWQPQPPTYYFEGDIDELTVWNKAFTTTGVIDTLMQLSYCPADPNLLWYFNFNNCSYISDVNSGQLTNSLYYQNGVLPVPSNCPVAPTLGEITTGPVAGSPFCTGGTLSVPYTATASFLSCNIFTVQLSDSNGNFGSPVNIGDSASIDSNGSIYATIPTGTPPGSKYRVRVISSAPDADGTPDSNALVINSNVNASVSISAPALNNCSGTPVSFTAAPVNGGTPVYEWFKDGSPVGGNSNTYTDSTPGNGDVVRCEMISTAGCTPDTVTSNLLTVSINNVNAGTIAAIKDTLCQGSTAQLSVTGAKDSVLQWQSSVLPDNFTNITGADTAIYQTLAMQSTVFRVVVSSGICMDTSAPLKLLVYPVPAPPVLSASDTLICSSDSAQIVAPSGFSAYLWNTGDTTYYIYANEAESYWVTVTDNNGCTAISRDININVYPAPVPVLEASDTLICSSDSARITTTIAFTSYQWNTGDTIYYTYAKGAGGYWVTVTDNNGCTAISRDININVYPVPSVSIDVRGDTLTSFGAHYYQWFINGNLIQGATSNIYVAPQTGNYSVQVTDSNGCNTLSNSVPVIVNGLADLLMNSEWNVYPNPTSSLVYVSLTGNTGPAKLQLINMAGQQVKIRAVQPGKNILIPIDISNLPAGVYELIFEDDNRLLNARLVKE